MRRITGMIMVAWLLVLAIAGTASAQGRIENGELIIAEIHTDNGMENAIDITEAPPINEVSAVLDRVDENPYLTIQISDDEYEELRWVLALEAQTEGLNGEIACCEVIFNRVLSAKDWGSGVHGVLSKKGQFSTYKLIGSRKAWASPGQLEDDAISECLRQGPKLLPDMKYVFFDTGRKNGSRNIKLGHHYFGAEK